MVQEPVAREIVVYAHDIGWAGGIGDRPHPIAETEGGDPLPQRVLPRDPAEQQIPSGPPAKVVERCLFGQARGCIGTAEIVRLDQLRGRVHPTHGLHRQSDAIHLVEQCQPEGALVRAVRVPMAVESREAGGGQRLVDRRPGLDPGVALRDLGSKVGQAGRKRRVEQVGVAGTAAVMDQSDKGTNAEFPKPFQPLVRPSPIGRLKPVGCHPLPKHGVTDRLETEFGEAVQVRQSIVVAAQAALVEVPVARAVYRAFDTTPELDVRHPAPLDLCACNGCEPASFRTSMLIYVGRQGLSGTFHACAGFSKVTQRTSEGGARERAGAVGNQPSGTFLRTQ